MNFLTFCNKTIEFSFYTLFFLIPLVFTGSTSELFEFNKMWLAFALTIIIALAWFTKITLQKRISVQKTPLDIPIALFFISQIISSVISLDPHVSWWGYYSRFNGGLLSIICYIFLYYAFVSNLSIKHVLTSLWVTLASGVAVAVWGFPAHFGYDPTCLVFRGTFDTGCWTDAFKPTIRTFSTLGQPAWLAAYLALLLPLTIVYALKNQWKTAHAKGKMYAFLLLIAFFYISLVFANTRAGFLGFGAADILLWIVLFYKKLFSPKLLLKYFVVIHAVLILTSFLLGAPGGYLEKYTLPSIMSSVNKPAPSNPQSATPTETAKPTGQIKVNDINITDSGVIRLLVWDGAIKAWKDHPIFGTGVETFAFAYYKYKSPQHNMTSEWDYLYNKAHNEYLNYLTTTGAFGLGTYVLFIGFFIFYFLKYVMQKQDTAQVSHTVHDTNPKHSKYAVLGNAKQQSHLAGHSASDFELTIISIGLFAGWVSILITNFFGFSVVIMNIYLFLIPAFFFILAKLLNPKKTLSIGSTNEHPSSNINPYQWTAIALFIILAGYLLLGLFRYWYADVDYALGHNLDGVNGYQQAYPKLLEAVNNEPNEPVYQDELSINLATLAAALYAQKDTTNGAEFAKNAIALSDQVVAGHPNNVVFWKNRVRIFYTLSETDPANQQAYYMESLKSINKAADLAPTDAKIAYNQGVLYGQTGDTKKAIEVLKHTVELKPNYRDAYYALGLFYRQLAVNKDNKVVDTQMQQKAIDIYKFILKNISPDDKQVNDSLTEWGASK